MAERVSHLGHRLDKQWYKHVVSAVAASGLALGGADTAGADVIPFRTESEASRPFASYQAMHPWRPITKSAAEIPGPLLDAMVKGTAVLNVIYRDTDGTDRASLSSAGIVENPFSKNGIGLTAVAHSFDRNDADYPIVARSDVAAGTRGFVMTPWPVDGAQPQSPALEGVWFVNNKGWGDPEWARAPGETDGMLVEGENGEALFRLPYPPMKVAKQPLAVGQRVYFVAPSVNDGAYAGTVTGAVIENGESIAAAQFDPIGDDLPLQQGVSGANVVVVEEGEPRSAGNISGAYLTEGRGTVALVTQNAPNTIRQRRATGIDLRQASIDQHLPNPADSLPVVHPEGTLSRLHGFEPRNTGPGPIQNRTTVYQRGTDAVLPPRRLGRR